MKARITPLGFLMSTMALAFLVVGCGNKQNASKEKQPTQDKSVQTAAVHDQEQAALAQQDFVRAPNLEDSSSPATTQDNLTSSNGKENNSMVNATETRLPKTSKKDDRKPTWALFNKTTVPSMKVVIDNSKEAVINGFEGTLVSIPRNCFVTKSGKPVNGPIEIELKEVFNKSDLLLSNVPTISDGKMLETNGSIYINATADGKQLKLAEGKGLYVELPNTQSNRDMLVFSGAYTDRGDMNWKPIGTLSKLMYTLPFEALNLRTPSMAEATYQKIIQPENRNSFLATRAFEKRLQYIENTSHLHNRTNEIVEFYIRNKDLSLFEVDNKVINYFSELSKCYPYVEEDDNTHKGVFKARKRYKDFYDEKLTRADLIYTHEVDLSADDAYQQLLQKGMSPDKADKVMQHYATRNALIERNRLERERLLMERKSKQNMRDAAQEFAQNNFEINELGWINVDKFAKFTAPFKLTIKLLKPDQVFAEAYLVFKSRKSVVAGTLDQSGKFSIFKRIPKGEEAYIVAIGVNGERTYAATKMIKIGSSEVEEVLLEETEMTALQNNMKGFDQY